MKVLGFFSLLLGLVACTPSPETKSHVNLRSGQGVVGGLEVEHGSPFAKSTVMITLDDDQGQSFICTGTFISEKLILTASHCATPNPLKMSVLFGLNPLSGRDYGVVPILKVHWYAGVLEDHSEKKQAERHDLALIEYSGGLPSGAVALALARPSSPRVTEFFSGGGKTPRSITALGYGRTTGKELTGGDDLGGTGLLRVVELQVSQFDRNGVTFTVDQKKEKGVCFGDSGGPALLASERLDDQPKLQLIGVASGVFSDEGVDEYALGFDPCAQNSLYTNIIPYLDWIDSIEKSVGPAPTTASAQSANPNRN